MENKQVNDDLFEAEEIASIGYSKAEKIEPAQNGKVAHLAIESCTFCKSTEISVFADITIKDDMQINYWYVECQQCLARGSKQDARDDAIYMWNRTMGKTYEILELKGEIKCIWI